MLNLFVGDHWTMATEMKVIHLVLTASLAATAAGSDTVGLADADGGDAGLLRQANTAYRQGQYTEVV